MAKLENTKKVNVDGFKGQLKTDFEAFKAARDKADALWAEFVETAKPTLDKMAPKGKVIVPYYKYGNLMQGEKDAPKGTSGNKDAVSW